MSAVCYNQEVVKDTISRTIGNTESILPPEVLKIFFRELPRKRGISFVFSSDSVNIKIYSAEEIEKVEKEISGNLLEVYRWYTQAPSVREVLSDIFDDLEDMKITVLLRNK